MPKNIDEAINPSRLKQEVIDSTPAWQATKLNPEEEVNFQRWFKALPWTKQIQAKYGETPDPNYPGYDYRKAYQSGVTPEHYPYGNSYHWTSKTPSGEWLKSPQHPTAWMEAFMEKTGMDPNSGGIQALGIMPRVGMGRQMMDMQQTGGGS